MEQQQAADEAGETKLGLIESIRFKNDMRIATYHYRKANEAARMFWQSVKAGDSMWRQTELADGFRDHADDADWLFKRLLLQFSKSHVAVEMYTSFLRQIMGDDRGAAELEVQSSRLMERREQQMQQQQQQASQLRHSGSYQLHGSRTAEMDEQRESFANDLIAYNALVSSVGRPSLGRSNLRRWTRGLDRLSTYIYATVALLISGHIIIYAMTHELFRDPHANDVVFTGGLCETSQAMTYYTRQLEIAATGASSQAAFDMAQVKLFEHISNMTKLITHVRTDEVTGQEEIIEAWTNTGVDVITRNTAGTTFASKLDPSTVLNAFTVDALDLSQYTFADAGDPGSTLSDHAFEGNVRWAFVLDNGLRDLTTHIWDVAHETTLAIRRLVVTEEWQLRAGTIALCSVAIFLITVLLVPAYIKFARERRDVMELFRGLPSSALDDMLLRHKVVAVVREEDASQSHKSSMRSFGTLELLADKSGAGVSTELLFQTSRPPPWVRMMTIFTAAMVLMAIAIGLMSFFVFRATTFLENVVTELNAAEGRLCVARELLALSQELVRQDQYVWSDFSELRGRLTESLAAV